MDHPIQCTCGALKGVLKKTGREIRCVCYCKDCQAFAHFLKSAETVLDVAGGTEIIQTSPQNLTFTDGIKHLACMRLSEKGMVRWYASCCNTPIGNTTASGKIAFVGLIHNSLESDGRSLANAFGPITTVFNGQSAVGEVKPKTVGAVMAITRVVSMIVKARLSGRYKQTPFFDSVTDMPVVAPTILSADERQLLATH